MSLYLFVVSLYLDILMLTRLQDTLHGCLAPHTSCSSLSTTDLTCTHGTISKQPFWRERNLKNLLPANMGGADSKSSDLFGCEANSARMGQYWF